MYTFFSYIVHLIWGSSEERGVSRWVTVPLIAIIVVAFFFFRTSCFNSSDSEKIICLAHLSFDGNQAAVLSTRGGFGKGSPVCFVYKGNKFPEWNFYFVPDEKRSKWRNVRIENTEEGIELYQNNSLEFIIPFSDLKYDKKRTIQEIANGAYTSNFMIILYEIDESHPLKMKHQTESR